MSKHTDGQPKPERFVLGIWGKSMTRSLHSNPKMARNGHTRGFRKPRNSKMRWYLIIGLSILIVAITVVVISLAVHFATNDNESDKIQQEEVETLHFGKGKGNPITTSTTQSMSSLPTSSQRTSTGQASQSSTMSVPGTPPTIADLSTSPHKSITTKPTVKSKPTTTRSTSTVTTATTSTMASASQSVVSSTKIHVTSSPKESTTGDINRSNVTSDVSSVSSTSATASTDATTNNVQTTQGTDKTTKTDRTDPKSTTADLNNGRTTTHSISTFTPFLQPVISIKGTDIILPFSSTSLSMTCFAINVKNWMNLKIIRSHENADLTLVEVRAGIDYPSVYVADVNFTSEVSYKQDALMVTLKSEAVDCGYIGNYTCVLTTPDRVFRNDTEVGAVHTEPELVISTSIVEGQNITLQCSTEIPGTNGSMRWKVRPPGLNKYFDLSLTPRTSISYSNCSTKMTSVLSFTTQMHDNSSFFRCEISNKADDSSIYSSAESQFLVVPKKFCNNKGTYSVHKHPYNPCNMVVYCFVDGPHVYQIDCDPGKCYDKDTTRCIPAELAT